MLSWLYTTFCISVGLACCAIVVLNGCTVPGWMDNEDLPRGWGRWFAISIFASFWANNTYWMFWLRPLSTTEPILEPFSVTSTIAVSIFLFVGAGIGFGLLALLSARIGPDFVISLHRFPHAPPAPDTSIPLGIQVTQTLRRAESSSEEEEEKAILQASVHFIFAVHMLLLALSYYWQIYDPSGTMKPQWVGVFG